MQKSTDLLLRRNPFIRLVRARAQEFDPDMRFQAGALALLQVVVENELTGTFSTAQIATLHGKRITLSARDIRVARLITTMAPGKPLTSAPIVSEAFTFASMPVRTTTKAKKPQKAQSADAADAPQQDDEEEDEAEAEANNEPNTEEAAAINPLVQAVAQEMTVRDEAPASVPGTPKERRAPATPTKDKKKAKAGKKDDAAAANQFNDDDMAVFS